MSSSRWKLPLLLLMLPIGVGTASALVAQGFVAAVVWLNELLLISPERRAAAPADALLAATLLVPTLGGLCVGLIRRYAGAGNLQGPADVIGTVQTRAGGIAPAAGPASAGASLVSIGSGAAVGEYGPLVHMGGSLGSALARLFRAEVTTVNIAIACGVAAAISTVFNAPLAGILFAHEIVLRHFAPRAFAPVALAALIGYIVGNALSVRVPMLAAGASAELALWEFGPFVLLGMAGALLAIGFMHAILGAERLSGRIRRFETLKPAAAGLVLGVVALQLPEVLGMGFDLLRTVITGDVLPPAAMLALILVARVGASAMCLGFGFTGGVFAPAMVTGALFGSLVGLALDSGLGLPVASVGVYAICGMVAVTAPVIGAPVTAVVIVLEMTGSYPLTLAALASVGISNALVSRLFGRCLFDRQLKQRKLDLSAGRSKAMLESRDIEPLVTDRFVARADDDSVSAVRRAMIEAHHSQAFLVDGNNAYRGSVQLKDLMDAEADKPAVELRNRDDVVMLRGLSIWRAMQRIRRFDGESVAVIDEHNRLVGALYASDLIDRFLELQADLRGEEHLRAE